MARLWDVPEEDVVMLATRCEIRTTWVNGYPMFNADDVEWCTEPARTRAAHDRYEPTRAPLVPPRLSVSAGRQFLATRGGELSLSRCG